MIEITHLTPHSQQELDTHTTKTNTTKTSIFELIAALLPQLSMKLMESQRKSARGTCSSMRGYLHRKATVMSILAYVIALLLSTTTPSFCQAEIIPLTDKTFDSVREVRNMKGIGLTQYIVDARVMLWHMPLLNNLLSIVLSIHSLVRHLVIRACSF